MKSDATDLAISQEGRSHASSSRDVYQRYLDELRACPRLTPDEELALARTIVDRELALWCVLLSHRPALRKIEETLARDGLPEGWAAFLDGAAPGPLARELRALDATRERRLGLERTLEEWCRSHGDTAYAERLAAAQRAYRRASDEMVRANLRLVVSLARRYGTPRLMAAPDFIQEGNLGLLRAVERFDPERGVRFSTYAVWWIRFAFNRALSDRGRLVRIPGHALEEGQRLARAKAALEARFGRAPTLDELVEETGLAAERASQFSERNVGRPPLSLDLPMGEGKGSTLLDVLAAPEPDVGEQLDLASFDTRVRPLLAKLTEMEAAILRYRFGLDEEQELTLREVGEKYGLTRERIRQLQEKALGKLRKELAKADY